MPECAFLTMDNLDGFVSDDALAVSHLEAWGWRVTWTPWRQPHRWEAYDLVIIRTPWDYQHQPDAFLATLAAIEYSGARLENPLSLVRWNLHKSYLQSLAAQGVPIVPTRWETSPPTPALLQTCLTTWRTHALALKPVISANADHTYCVLADHMAEHLPLLQEVFNRRPYMIQPFMPAIVDEGEFSLFYFAGAYSHAILKTPRPGDFRVQEEHGGFIQAVTATPTLLTAGRRALEALPQLPLYARVDLVRDGEGAFRLMELELIEPALYLRMDADAPHRFATAVAQAVKSYGAPATRRH